MKYVLGALLLVSFLPPACADETADAPATRAAHRPPVNGDLLFARGDYARGHDEHWRLFAARGGGGNILPISPLAFARPPLPSPDGRRVAFSTAIGRKARWHHVHVAPLRGGTARSLTPGRRVEWPAQWSPDGERLLVGIGAGVGHDNVAIVEADGTSRRLVRVGGTAVEGAQWSPDGRYLLTQRGSLGPRAVYLLDTKTWRARGVTGDDEQVTALFAPGGRIALLATRERPLTHELWLADRTGSNRELVLSTRGDFWGIEWSPDGTRLAVSVLFGSDDTSRLVVVPAAVRGVRITRTSGVAGRHAVWSPDGTKLAFVRGRFPRDDVWVRTADGSVERRLTRTRLAERPVAWLPAGGG